ncbi:hydroxypyruvate isomerase family protein [Amycolatopsis panacis]|uniref:Hydroxypyruvate isomerase n=1 Tax=Amycolatopsis panacis TaxID=2340917 RepID=A0A419HY97_9PSEU|nr:TIM barrel protein [Amycolatopsis panacis]RJQ82120.1 hydroxypyruvate isomerase [Amycolatopsis panacis]
MLFTELPLLERASAAREAGFAAVEFWWPFDSADPGPAEVAGFVRSIERAGVQLTGLNFYAGDLAAGERGLVSWVGREAEFRAALTIAVGIAERLGCRSFNALYGNRIPGVRPSEQDDVALVQLRAAAEAADGIGAQLVIEPLSGVSDYPLRTAADVLAVLDRIGLDNVRLLADLYHLAVNGDDLGSVIAAHTPRIGHVQIADAPGRHQPGTGQLDLAGCLEKLQAAGYRGHVGVEYEPDGSTVDSLEWLPRERRGC